MAGTTRTWANKEQSASEYLFNRMPLIVLFILLTLFLNWIAGAKATQNFLLLILIGQLTYNAEFIADLFQT